MNKNLKGILLLFAAALIWGSSFVSQSAGMDYVDPFTFNTCRSLVGSCVLIPLVVFFRQAGKKEHPLSPEEESGLNRRSIFAGFFCGLALSAATSFQQIGISMTTAGKTGFITALYIIIVPILGILLKKSVPRIIWFCAFVSLAGFYLLCIKDDFSISAGDYYCLVCAFCFSVQIMCIDHFTKHEKKLDPVLMSLVQFIVVTIVSLVLMLVFESPDLNSIYSARYSILYAGAMSSGVAYTFQILGQRYTNPAVAPLIMSLESVFAVLFGWLMLNESMSVRELSGCALVFLAVILSQLPLSDIRNRLRREAQ